MSDPQKVFFFGGFLEQAGVVPTGSRIIAIRFCYERLQLECCVCHAGWDPVKEGEIVPLYEAPTTVEQWEAAREWLLEQTKKVEPNAPPLPV